jgi:alkylated DNA nucleotide flippase Atl1
MMCRVQPVQPGEPSPYDERVLDVVAQIPVGKVMSYGDVAEYLGAGGPRQVGQVMSRNEAEVPWWRVLHADGSPPPALEIEALALLRADGTPLRPDGARVDMRRARWDGRPGTGPDRQPDDGS